MRGFYNKYLFLYGLLIPAFILFVKGTSLLYYLSAGQIVLMIGIHKGRIKFSFKRLDILYTIFVGVSVFSTLSAVLYNEPDQWKWQAFVFFVYSFLMFFVYAFLEKESTARIKRIVLGLRWGFLLNIILGYIQFFLYRFFRYDINEAIFGKILKTVSTASHYHYGELVPTGFTWHPGAFAPILVGAYCMFYDNYLVKLLILGISVLTKSSTCILGVIVCVLLEAAFRFYKARKQFRKRTVIVICAIVLILVFVFIQAGFVSMAVSEIERLFQRVQGIYAANRNDLSTYYHVRYYTGLREVLGHANPIQILFGVGGGCSGHAFMLVFGQYAGMAPWDVESQIVADMISYGLVGFAVLSLWMLRMIKYGSKIDKRYTMFLVSMIIMSFTYNVRFSWVLAFLFLISVFIRRKLNIWECADSHAERKTLQIWIKCRGGQYKTEDMN